MTITISKGTRDVMFYGGIPLCIIGLTFAVALLTTGHLTQSQPLMYYGGIALGATVPVIAALIVILDQMAADESHFIDVHGGKR